MQHDDAVYMEKTSEFAELSKRPYADTFITIGNFDGVHLGHQALIGGMVQEAHAQGSPALVVTFFPNPAEYFRPDVQAYYLTTPVEKHGVMEDIGVDELISFQFNKQLSELTAREFLTSLKNNLDLSMLVIGDDFALGKNRQGTIPVIKELGAELGFSVVVINQVQLDCDEISSTRIRRYLDLGDVASAGRLLGRPYEISGIVQHGSDRGAGIGLPTANIGHWTKKKLPGIGVYATRVYYQKMAYVGITNIGYRPTFETQDIPNIETHLLDFNENLYGKMLTLQFIIKLRDEQKFSGIEAFLGQIEKDKETARKIVKDEKR